MARGFKDDHGKFHPIDGSKGTVGMRVKENSNHVEGMRLKRNNSSGIKKSTGIRKKKETQLFSKLEELADPSADERYFDVKGVIAQPILDDADPPKTVSSDVIVRTLNIFEATGDSQFEDEPYVSELLLVPQNKSLDPNLLDTIAGSAGIEPNEVDIVDKVTYGASIRLGSEITGKDAIEVTNEVSRNAEALAGLIGFSLDSPVNRIGTTGWDLLRQFALGEKAF